MILKIPKNFNFDFSLNLIHLFWSVVIYKPNQV